MCNAVPFSYIAYNSYSFLEFLEYMYRFTYILLQIRESDIQIHHLPLEERQKHVKLGIYPPQIVITLYPQYANVPELQCTCQAVITGTDNENPEFFTLSAVSQHSGSK